MTGSKSERLLAHCKHKIREKNEILASYVNQLDELKRENQRLKNKIFVLDSLVCGELRKQNQALQTRVAIHEHPDVAKEIAESINGMLSTGK